MMRLGIATVGVLAAVGSAPMQCGHGHDSGEPHEESAGDALYALAQDFHTQGNDEASRQTLRTLVAKYPSSRHAPAARAELASASDSRTDAGQ